MVEVKVLIFGYLQTDKNISFQMNTETLLTTDRLLIEPLVLADNNFILELVNTDGWIKFIGNRKITSPMEATAYIQ